uniref:AB hydrolase-1 domain-containing protein n=1 Tax=Kalanchoe fedtschenkoi TaxID=63787 RepID=A0A7N0SYS2_KALFE
MGNLMACPRLKSGSRSSRRTRKMFQQLDPQIQQQILAATVFYHQQQQQSGGGATGLNRSTSTRPAGRKKASLLRSSSERPRSPYDDPLVQPQQLVQEAEVDELGRKHFVLVHGGGFGAWCWYKTMALLEEAGFRVTAVDLAGSGVDSYDPNAVTSITQHMQPVTEFLEKLPKDEKVILVGHDLGGVFVSCAMEFFARKISKAVFIAAVMLTDGQSVLDAFQIQSGMNDLMQEIKTLLYANGRNNPPTAINFDRSLLKDLLFNKSPAKDVALASVSMRPIPFAPFLEKLSLSEMNYGVVRKFYIETLEDNCIPNSVQESMVNGSPPERVFRLKGSDHCPFFSKPQALHKILVQIAELA